MLAPPSGNGEFQARQQRQDLTKQNGVFGRELARDPTGAGIVDVERRLHTGEVSRPILESGEGGAQLLRMRPIFRVVDNDIIATRIGKRRIERLGLGAWRGGRNDHDVDMQSARHGERRGNGVDVVAFDDQFDVERRAWVIRYYGANATTRFSAFRVERS